MPTQDLFNAAAERLASRNRDVEQGRIFHSQGLKTHGKFFGFVRGEELVLKLPAARVRELIEEGTGEPFDAGKGRPMREWVRVRPADESGCSAYLAEAREFVSGGTSGG